jgi:hypothetical protein
MVITVRTRDQVVVVGMGMGHLEEAGLQMEAAHRPTSHHA